MVKQLLKWQCEVCGRKFARSIDAVKCEADIPASYPIGCMYAHYGTSVRDTFAVAVNRVEVHENNGGSWWSKYENVHKLFVGHQHTCGGGTFHLTLDRSDRHVDLDLPTAKRMIEWLESQGITPTVWDGGKAISLEEARAHPERHWRYKTGF